MGFTARWWTIPVLALLVLSSIAVIFFLVLPKSKNQSTSNTKPIVSTTPQPKGSSVLSFGPQVVSTKDKKLNVGVEIDAESDKISAVELHLNFDPKQIQVNDITVGSFLSKPSVFKKDIDNKKGEVIFTVGTLSPSIGSGTIAEVQIEGLKAGEIKISTTGSKAAAVGKSEDVLVETREGVFTIE